MSCQVMKNLLLHGCFFTTGYSSFPLVAQNDINGYYLNIILKRTMSV